MWSGQKWLKKVIKRSVKKVIKAPAQKMSKYFIKIIQKKGMYRNRQVAEAEKQFIKNKVPHSKFSQITGTSKGFSFKVLHDYTESFPTGTSTTALQKAFKTQSLSVVSVKVKKV